MLDFAALLHDPAYAIYGTSATITPRAGDPVSLTVIDKSSGLAMQTSNQHHFNGVLTTVQPAAYVRMVDISAAGWTRQTLRNAILDMNGKTWRVEASEPKPVASGEAGGELMLLLIEV
jgi:hypothetical protein